MSRKSERPEGGVCPAGKSIFCSPPHQWSHSNSWNGNNDVVGFLKFPHGLARSGWRCFNCCAFRWDQTDLEYALVMAYAQGLIKLPNETETEKEWS